MPRKRHDAVSQRTTVTERNWSSSDPFAVRSLSGPEQSVGPAQKCHFDAGMVPVLCGAALAAYQKICSLGAPLGYRMDISEIILVPLPNIAFTITFNLIRLPSVLLPRQLIVLPHARATTFLLPALRWANCRGPGRSSEDAMKQTLAMNETWIDRFRGEPAAVVALAVFALSSATLAGAWYFQLALKIMPCPLCLEQRISYYDRDEAGGQEFLRRAHQRRRDRH